jgi:hypothetical protein
LPTRSFLFSEIESPHAPGLSLWIQFHYVENPIVVLTTIQNGVAARRRENLLEVKMQFWGKLQTKAKMFTEL